MLQNSVNLLLTALPTGIPTALSPALPTEAITDFWHMYRMVMAVFCLTLILSLFLVPLVRRWAMERGLFDAPGGRKIHTVPVPRLGGVAIWVSCLVTFGLFLLFRWEYPHGNSVLGVLVGATLMFILGVLDDLYNLSPYVKLAGQVIAASVAFWLGVQIEFLDLPWSKILMLNALSYPVTVMWLVGFSNALNFIDGVDGLAGGVTTISALTLVVVALFTDQPTAALLAALLAGGTLGFLVFNLHPARIFMGDSGALFAGFMLSSIAITGVLKTQAAVVVLPAVVLSVPIMDIVFSTLRRLFKLKNPFMPDADHLHHRLLKAGLTPQRTTYVFYGVCILSGMIATSYVQSLYSYVLLVFGVLALTGLLVYVLRRGEKAEKTSETPFT